MKMPLQNFQKPFDDDWTKTNDIPKAIQFGQWLADPPKGEEIVITGLSGTYPKSHNVNHFRDNLYNKVDMISDDDRRWSSNHPEILKRSGKLYNIQKFDAGYFGIHNRQARTMNPIIRILLEKATEAIFDAGINPDELAGTKTGVFVGSAFSENEETWLSNPNDKNNFVVTGCTRSMLANRISYHLKLKGNSFTCDTACSSSLYALEHAYRALRNDECDMAIVGGSNLCLNSNLTLQFAKLGLLSMDGVCKVFDEQADGYVRSDAIVAIFLQKSKSARRVYAKLIHVKTNCDGYKEQGITFSSSKMQKILQNEFYQECKIDPITLSFLEAHGTGTKVGDPEELLAIDEIFCKNRKTPLLIGAVKSNMGHSEATSGLCSITKVIIGMENNLIPPNINYHTPRLGIDALKEGRLKVVTEKIPFEDNRALVGVNSFGFGGGNCHVLLEWNHKQKANGGLPKDNLPRLVCVSGRIEKSVTCILNDLKNRQLDAEYIRLYHQIFSKNASGHLFRGYSILSKTGEITRSTQYFDADKKPLYLAFSSFGDAYCSIASDLLVLPMFAASIQRIHDILSKYNIDIKSILLNNKKTTTLYQILGTMAVQIGLVDIIRKVNIGSKAIFGLGSGAFICSYFDQSLNLEQTVLATYETALIIDKLEYKYSYIVGLAEDKVRSIVPMDIDIIKTISKNTCIITGKLQGISGVIDGLVHKGIGVSKIDYNISIFYTKEFPNIKSQLREKLSKIITEPKLRSKKWLSSSKDQLATPEFFLKVLAEPSNYIPEIFNKSNVILEIGNGHLLALKSNIKNEFSFLGFKKSERKNNFVNLLEILGSLYEFGHNFEIDQLYPAIQYPVSRGTPMMSHLIEWNHTRDWAFASYNTNTYFSSTKQEVTYVKLDDPVWQYINGHVIDGRNLFPATGYLQLVWNALAIESTFIKNDMQLVFENCKFYRATTVRADQKTEFLVNIQKFSGNFEIMESNAIVVSGRISTPSTITKDELILPIIDDKPAGDDLQLQNKDIYKELRLRGYIYSGKFRQIRQCNKNVTRGLVRWDGNFVAFMDNMLQLKILQTDTRFLYVPTTIKRLSIDAKRHISYAKSFGEEKPYLPVYIYNDLDIIKCGGIEIKGIQANSIARRKPRSEPILEKYLFIPNDVILTLEESVRVNMQLSLENSSAINIKCVELLDEGTDENVVPLSLLIHQVLSDLPLIRTNITILTDKPLVYPEFSVKNKSLATETDCNFVVGTNIIQRTIICQQAFGALKENGFIITRESLNYEINLSDYPQINVLTTHILKNEKIFLICKSKDYENKQPTIIKITNDNFDWLPVLQNAIKNDVNVIVYSQNERLSGILGLINCIRCEQGGNSIKCVFIMDEAPSFDPNNIFYSNQLKKNFAINIYKDHKWGSYRHLLLPELKEVQREHCYVNVTVRGDLSSLTWIEGPLTSKTILNPDQELISIYYAAINFKDVLTASGRINVDAITMDRTMQECVQGFEFSGRNSAGKRYMGMVACGALSTLVAADKYMMWKVPDVWTLEEAATVPVVYSTVLYCFFVEHTLKSDETVLIHSGAGGIGQAAIHVALHHGCTVYTTVGTKEKREFLKRRFPQLTDQHIGNSRDTSFEQMIFDQTNGTGVNIVLNSLAEEKLQASIRCLANRGKFFEIGKFDLANNTSLRLLFLQNESSFHGIVIDQFFNEDPMHKLTFRKLLQTSIDSGYVKPIARIVFKDNQIEEAFRYMSSGNHIGKVLINIRKEEPDKMIAPLSRLKSGIPRYCCNNYNSYVIIGGLGGFGLELADWLILRGARKLILTSRHGLSTGYQVYRQNIWKSYGALVHISTANVITRKGCEQLIKEANQFGPVTAIFNLAVVLKDALLEEQNIDNFVTSFEPKAYATMNLDQVTRTACPELKDFVVFSSVSCGRGNAGQTNYGMSNSVMERICEKRRNEGLPGLAIEWGAIGEVGLVADMQEQNTEIEIGGTLQQQITSCLNILDILLNETNPIVGSMVVAEKRLGSGAADNIVDAVAKILGIRDVKTVSLYLTLPELGMDSMTGVEISQTLEREFEVVLTVQEIRKITFAKLQEIQDVKNHVDKNLLKKAKKLEGLDALLRLVSNKSVSQLPLIVQETKVKNDSTAPKVIFLPGVEGMANVFDELNINMHVHALAVQYPLNMGGTVDELTAYILPYVEKNISTTKPFNLVAYSYGCVLALELIAILETKGYLGHLICIDGAPRLFAEALKIQLDLSSEAQFQTSLLFNCLTVFLPLNIVLDNKNRILCCGSLEERMKIVEEIIPTNLPNPVNYYTTLILNLYQRLRGVIEYQPTFQKLKSKIILYKPEEPILADFANDYHLAELCENPLEIKTFKGNHATILDNVKVGESMEEVFH